MRPGFHEVVLSVFDIDRIAGPMCAVGGYVRRDLPPAPQEQRTAWHMPGGCNQIAQSLLTAPQDAHGALRIVRFEGVEQQIMRSSQHAWDSGGIFDVDIYSDDATGTYAALQSYGWTAFSDPIDYSFGDLHVREVVINGPDGLAIGLIQRLTPPLDWPEGLGAMSRSFNSSQIVRDYDIAAAFYRDILGWKALVELSINGEAEPAAVIGLPMPCCAGVERRVGIWHPEGTNDGSIELIACRGITGRDFAARAVAPNVGLLSLRLPIDNTKAFARQIESRGWPLYAEPIKLELAPYGRAILFSVRTPDGAILEFYEISP